MNQKSKRKSKIIKISFFRIYKQHGIKNDFIKRFKLWRNQTL